MDTNYFGFTNYIYLFLSYIIPSTSSYVHQSDDDVLENIEKDISLKYRGRGDIILCGDLNARWGSEPDFIQNDSHLPIYDSYICDKVHEVRKSYDSKLDTRGKQLLELCITARMRILNGRMLGDSNGTFTCYRLTWNSVVDYVIVSEELWSKILFFKVADFIPGYSDCHCKLSFGLLATYAENIVSNKIRTSSFPSRYIWSESSSSKFQDALCHSVCKSKIFNFSNQILEGTDTDEVASDFLNIWNEAACKANNLCRNSKKKKSSICNTNKWFDQDLRVKRKTLLSKGALLSKFPFDPIDLFILKNMGAAIIDFRVCPPLVKWQNLMLSGFIDTLMYGFSSTGVTIYCYFGLKFNDNTCCEVIFKRRYNDNDIMTTNKLPGM